ncbi:MAG TPA: GNAT family N-acetyltransferase [Actinospica sp.]|nr:GNAT family N-acetyltransferase [Actinospica sp.]HWG26523.1 GNAT family N-acetyltransferase [Actinospica sp.]
MFAVRPYQDSDEAAMRDICMRTGNAGGDARGLYRDQDLISDIFAIPYAVLEPEFAFVADDGGRAVGYIVGTPDTARFIERFREQWLPRVADLHIQPSEQDDFDADPDGWMAALLHNPERMLKPGLAAYPAHLHIDLLPQAQGKGAGRALMNMFLAALNAAGAEAVHLSMATSNTGARAFYDRMGFTEIRLPDQSADLTYLIRPTAQDG